MAEKLLIRDFFEYFDITCPYHCGSMMELQEAIERADPTILSKDAQWFQTWSQSGKRRKVIYFRFQGDPLQNEP